MISKLSPLLLTAFVVVSCAKKESYDKVHKEAELQTKNSFFTPYSAKGARAAKTEAFANESTKNLKEGMSKKFLYVPMTLGTPREVADANPFYQGDTKLVRMQFTKEGLEIFEIEKDDRFSDNTLNNTPVLTIPGEYKAFQCKEDSYGKCENAEEENDEITWDRKSHFKPDYADLEVKEVNMLDVANIEASSCVKPNGVRLVNYEVKKDSVINIELEKTYKLSKSWRCIRNNYYNDKFSYNSFKVKFFYSLVALDELASKDYEKLEYPLQDHDVYGYFKNESKKLNDDFDTARMEETYLANRWNPKKEVLKYYLSASYSKPKNKAILKATMKSMEVMNKNLESAGANFRLEFITQTKENEKSPGDLRYNSIVLIDDPLANGLLGYAPSVKNPETGEIVQSHINMYGGVLTSGTRWVYSAAVDIMEDQLKKESSLVDAGIKVSSAAISSDVLPAVLVEQNIKASALNHAGSAKAKNIIAKSSYLNTHKHHAHISGFQVDRLNAIQRDRQSQKVDFKARFDRLMSGDLTAKNELEKQALMKEGSELGYKLDINNAPEFFPIAGTTKVVYPDLLKIKDIKDSRGILKRWSKLTQLQKDLVKEIIIVNRYVSTFVHEMGHSLGLRHNFAGSTDGDNFYSDKEVRSILSDNTAKAPAYSSVMDYAFSEYNELASFGKYDVAALKFSYSGKMQTVSGKGVSVPKGVLLKEFKKAHNAKSADKIVDFSYCTDENAGLSTTCNRFDEGTTLLETTKHKIEKYKNWYKYRNFRNERNTFNSYGVPGYLIARYREFYQIRDLVEDYEVYAEVFSPELMAQGCSPAEVAKYPVCKDINDRRDSVLAAANFFIEILKTPDHLCAVANKEEPTKIVAFKKLIDIYEEVKWSIDKHVLTSCFEKEVKEFLAQNKEGEVATPLIVVGENGKYLNDFKDTNPEYKYVSDRAVRGIWADKVMAMRMLFERTDSKSSTDRNHMALVDHPVVKAKVQNILNHLAVGNPLENPIPFTMEDGNRFIAPYVLGNDYKVKQVEDYFGWIKAFVGLPQNGEGNLNEALLSQVTNTDLNFGDEMEDLVYETNNYVTVRKHRTYEDLNLNSDLQAINVGRFSYVAGEENVIAYEIGSIVNGVKVLKTLKPAQLLEILKRRTQLIAPEALSEDEKAFWGIEEGFQNFLIAEAKKKNPLTKEAFVATFGEAGEAVFRVYQEAMNDDAAKMEAILSDKQAQIVAMNTAPEGSSEAIKLVYKMNVNLIAAFATGRLSDELVEYYKKQLVRLPLHVDTLNI